MLHSAKLVLDVSHRTSEICPMLGISNCSFDLRILPSDVVQVDFGGGNVPL
jgi:hypothetical protein